MLTLIVILILSATVHASDRLPGLDDIASGYDAAKMLSASEQNSKYRIFDLSEASPEPLVLDIMSQPRSFQVPKYVNVVKMNLRKEDSCQTVSYTFQTFLYSFYQSVSFGFGIGIPGKFSFGVGYSATLRQIQESMTKFHKAVALSTIWWGQYSMQLGPPFMMKLDPQFIESVQFLATQAPNPSNEEHQMHYNQFIETYGTHYVSRVIVGGSANMYSLIDSSYHKSSSYLETSQQVSLMFQYKSQSGTLGSTNHQLTMSETESFKRSTATMVTFQPAVTPQGNQSDWETWRTLAGQQPVVVNRTLAPIYRLIRNDPTVREHLRKTVEFYLQNGVFPSYYQLRNPLLGRMALSPPKPIGIINGLDTVGCGYNVLTLENKFCMLDREKFEENELWSDPMNRSLTFKVPDGWFVTNSPELLALDGNFLVTSVEDYFRRTESISIHSSSSFLGFSRSYHFKRVREFYRRFHQEYYNLVIKMKTLGWYSLTVRFFPYPALNSIAQQAIDNMPNNFSPENITIWEEFFEIFGTHLVVSSTMGGHARSEIWYERCLKHERSERWIHEQIVKSGWFHRRSHESHSYTGTVDEHFRRHSMTSFKILGGDEDMSSFDWDRWLLTVKDHPRSISKNLVPLDEILPESEKRTAFKQAIAYVLNKAVNQSREYVNELQAERGPPPVSCSRTGVRTRRQISKPSINQMREELCPFLGFHGKECAGTKLSGRSFLFSNAEKLPISVGMTLDITTGKLLYPALQYNYRGANVWTDPATTISYQVPLGFGVLPVKQEDNSSVSRVFLTAAELSNEWRYEKLRGSWLGGEFGHSKSLLDVYSKFFANDQATAITHKPTVLYRIRVENLQLNKYAAAAIRLLTDVYKENLYADFIRHWGTHIVRQSLVGGMREQQTLFKDGVFSFNGAINTQNLQDYLKKDILSETLGNSFYADRRKIVVDHRLGGDPTENDEARWRSTLINNPALLKIEEYIPWYEIREIRPAIRENLRKIIDKFTFDADKIRIDEENQLMEQRKNRTYLPMDGFVGVVTNGKCIITKTQFASVKECSNGCVTPSMIKTTGDFLENQPIWYVRDESSGFISVKARAGTQTILEGPSVMAGCSSINNPNTGAPVAYTCIACDLVDVFANQCVCVCPRY